MWLGQRVGGGGGGVGDLGAKSLVETQCGSVTFCLASGQSDGLGRPSGTFLTNAAAAAAAHAQRPSRGARPCVMLRQGVDGVTFPCDNCTHELKIIYAEIFFFLGRFSAFAACHRSLAYVWHFLPLASYPADSRRELEDEEVSSSDPFT